MYTNSNLFKAWLETPTLLLLASSISTSFYPYQSIILFHIDRNRHQSKKGNMNNVKLELRSKFEQLKNAKAGHH